MSMLKNSIKVISLNIAYNLSLNDEDKLYIKNRTFISIQKAISIVFLLSKPFITSYIAHYDSYLHYYNPLSSLDQFHSISIPPLSH